MKKFLLAGAVAVSCWACASETAAPAAAASKEPSLFDVPQAQRGKLQVVTVARQEVARVLRVPAVVAFDDLKTVDVVPLVGGRIEKVMVHEGDHVKQDQALLTIASPDSSDNQANLKRDKATLLNKQTVLKRDQDLYEHKAISLEELQSAQLDVSSAQATLEDDEAHVRITGTGATHADLRSPLTGIVVARHASVGEAVQAGGNPVFTVTDPSLVWVIAHVYPEDVKRVAIGDAATLRSAAFASPQQGRVTYIGAAIDPDTLTVPIRIETENPTGVLKAGLYVDAEISPANRESVQVLPTASVLRDSDNLPFVYVEAEPGKFARKHVTLGEQTENGVIIRGGLNDGEHVLGDGALFIQFADSLEH